MNLPLSFLWLEITGKCQLECIHCYAESGPHGTHGLMRLEDWTRVIDQATELGLTMVQFIGGEPTLHPALPDLVHHALDRGLRVEVFSNLVRVKPELWELFQQPEVQLATSYYSATPAQHNAITQRDSHRLTRANIEEAVRRQIPLRVGVIGIEEAQNVDRAVAELEELGVKDVGVDHLRGVGRGIRDEPTSIKQLCGKCADNSLAVLPNGSVYPCIMSRWLPVGNVQKQSLARIHQIGALPVRRRLETRFQARGDKPKPPPEPSSEPTPKPPSPPPCLPLGCYPRCAPTTCYPGCCKPVYGDKHPHG